MILFLAWRERCVTRLYLDVTTGKEYLADSDD
jgi:hypothetical protein